MHVTVGDKIPQPDESLRRAAEELARTLNVELFGVLAQLARGSEAVLAGVVSTGVQEVEVAHPLGGH